MSKITNCIMSIIIIALITFSSVTYYRLESTRTELRYVRTELEAARNRQSDINEIVTRAGSILSESRNTLQGIREQIQLIKAVWTDMEMWLYSSDYTNNNTDNKTNKLKE